MVFAERSREYTLKVNNKISDTRIEGVLKDKVLLGKTPEKRPDYRNLQTIYSKKTNMNNETTYLDANASAILPKLANSLVLHHNKGVQGIQQRVDSLIDSYNETSFRK